MNNKIKNITIIASFVFIIYGLMFVNIIKADNDISYSERRVLAKAPNYSNREFLSGEFFEDYEKYFLDQFTLRDKFRNLKAFTSFNIFKQKDNNGVYIIDDAIYKMEYPLNENSIINARNKINEIHEQYLQEKNVSYAIIPDKNYFVAKDNGYLSMDYDLLIKQMKTHLTSINYIDIFKALDLDDYYRTDIHWKQDKIIDVAHLLLEGMGINNDVLGYSFEKNSLYPFYGSYYGQAGTRVEADTLVYLTNKTIEEAVVYDHIDKAYSKIYVKDYFESVDSYDFFLSGPRSLLTINNTNAKFNKELIIFRDSYGSSIAPLLLEAYSKITLVDLRYFKTDLLEEYIDFSKDYDVLFLYNTLILNNSYMLK